MEQLVSILVSSAGETFTLMVEPEGMSYEFPEAETVLLTFRGASAMKFELGYFDGGVSSWRPGDTEVWAAASNTQVPEQIGGWTHKPAPLLDSAAPKMDMQVATLGPLASAPSQVIVPPTEPDCGICGYLCG